MAAKKKSAGKKSSVDTNARVQCMVVIFAILSITFALLAFWRYGLGNY